MNIYPFTKEILLFKMGKPGFFCSILYKLLYDARDNPKRLAALEACTLKRPRPVQGHHHHVKKKSKNKGKSGLLLKFKISGNAKEGETHKNDQGKHIDIEIVERNQLFGGNTISVVKRMDMEEEEKIMKKNKSPCNDKKLQVFVSAVLSNGNSLSFRKRHRKGIPCNGRVALVY